jgi:polyisoprenyl-phosphate glycosyltransferase
LLTISTVTPVYAGAAYLEDLVSKLNGLRMDLEITQNIRFKDAIFVIDGTSDGSFELLQSLKDQYRWIVPVELSKNFGQHPATKAGILLTDSDFVVTLDEDLQHQPFEIKKMLYYMIEHKADIVYAHSEGQVHQSLFRNLCSRVVKKFFGYLAGNSNFIYFNSFRLINGSIARSASSIKGVNVYLDIALSWFCDRVTTAPINLVDTRIGNGVLSNYSIGALLRHAKRMAISTNTKIPKFLALLGFSTICLSFFLSVNIIYNKLFGTSLDGVAGWASISVTLLFFGGILTLMLSFVLEYVTYITLTVMGKPNFSFIQRIPFDLLAEDIKLIYKKK